jgi:hypothetical protein
MAGTLVRGSRRMRLATGVAHIIAAAMVGGAAGLLLAEAGRDVPTPISTALLTGLATAYLGAELGLWPLPVPQTGRQVPAAWRYRFPQPVTAALYGGALAPGIGTNVPFPSFVIVPSASILSGSLTAGMLIMGIYGVTRAVAAVAVAHLGVVFPQVDMGLGFQYRWALKLLIVIIVAAYTGGCVTALTYLL